MILKKISIFSFILMTCGYMGLMAQAQEPVDPLNWRDLVPFLIDLQGWDALGDGEGETMTMGTFKMTQVERSYESGDRSLEIEIVDGGYAPMAYAAINMAMSFEIDNSEEYLKKTAVNNFPGIEKYTYDDKEAEVMILIEERFIVRLAGENFEGTSELIDIAKNLDLVGLAKLAK